MCRNIPIQSTLWEEEGWHGAFSSRKQEILWKLRNQSDTEQRESPRTVIDRHLSQLETLLQSPMSKTEKLQRAYTILTADSLKAVVFPQSLEKLPEKSPFSTKTRKILGEKRCGLFTPEDWEVARKEAVEQVEREKANKIAEKEEEKRKRAEDRAKNQQQKQRRRQTEKTPSKSAHSRQTSFSGTGNEKENNHPNISSAPASSSMSSTDLQKAMNKTPLLQQVLYNQHLQNKSPKGKGRKRNWKHKRKGGKMRNPKRLVGDCAR
jgi:hypothetical protein